MEQIGVILLAGLTNGSVYGLVGLSISLIYGTNRVINFAQGEFVMLGVMSAILFMVTCALPLLPAIAAVLGVVLVAALALEFGVYQPLLRRGAPPLTIMIGTLAAAIIATGAALLVWGPLQLYVPNVLPLEAMRVGPLITNPQQIAIIVVFAALLALTWFLLYRTRFGLCIRATGVNARVALLMGIRSRRIVRFGFLFSALISGIVGLLVGPLLGGQVGMGVTLTVKGFMAAILGGLGSPFAAAAGGVLIALVEALVAGYGSSLYAEPIIFALILMILFFRPYGLLGDFEAGRH
ncbi:branched-chain amino acid ABC transporter permease [Pseudomonas mangiferae]|uniref:Branched-chain amino acid ABC transporter permease n=1 Tax=Pseudomonas mangiferae TaxID=2593654 RepID=A0A553GXE8_9PSED|nr:branched-chain amino acid ABC transporter permease [Pseudomonas mangiferae]TRX74167.1 branched-chain amino acid ABC transporter permease [Pseudomonas mangiferae]